MVKLEKLKSIRTNNGLTQRQMADLLNISQPRYARLEGGTQGTSLAEIIRMAALLRVHYTELLDMDSHQCEKNTTALEGSIPAEGSLKPNTPNNQNTQPMEAYTLETICRELKERKILVEKLKGRLASRKL